jgi:hypothetical protein
MPKKKCSFCKKYKSRASFNKDATRTDGISNKCRPCILSYQKGHFYTHHKTVHGYLTHTYNNMKKRVDGRSGHKYAYLWTGKPILPKETFMDWSKNHPDFLRLFKRWAMSKYDKKLSPSVNRIDSDKGYTLDNIEWVTQSQNCSLAGMARSFNRRRAVYTLLGNK